jgi:quercetin dioxygenase-like cupin family protein
MIFAVTPDAFTDEAQAVREVEARGWHAITFPAPGEVSEWHWHDFEAQIFILDGALRIEFDDGREPLACGPGARLDTEARVVHREITDGYRAVFGLSIDPATLTHPINKPAAQLVS